MKFTDKQFYDLFSGAYEYDDRDAYVSDLALSVALWADPEDPDTAPELTDDLLDALRNIWDVAHMTVKEIRAATGLSQASFARRFCIPTRTVENWEASGSAHRDCPEYVKLLLAQAVGALRVERDM